MKNSFSALIIFLFVNQAFGQWTSTGDNATQGSIKVKNYLLFDADGDFTGANYFTIQDDASGDFLRIGRGFDHNLVITSNG